MKHRKKIQYNNRLKQRKRKIFIFGNPDLKEDGLALKLLPKLKKSFPKIEFVHFDPIENFEIPKNFIVIDVVKGIKKIKVFYSLSYFKCTNSISLHNFDLSFYLFLLEKIGKLSKIKIIGLPFNISLKKHLKELKEILKEYEDKN